MDAIENILGIAVGSAIYWLLLRLMSPAVKHVAKADVAGE
jgi:hypothetical protein